MKTVKAKRNQTVLDICMEQYGNCEALGEVLVLNAGIRNDYRAVEQAFAHWEQTGENPAAPAPECLRPEGAECPIHGVEEDIHATFYPDIALEAGQEITVNDDSRLIRANVLRELTGDITTYDLDNGKDNQ